MFFFPQKYCDAVCDETTLCSLSNSFVYLMVPSARQKFVRRAWEKAGVNEKWTQSSWAKKIEAKRKVKAVVYIFQVMSWSNQFMNFQFSSEPILEHEPFGTMNWMIKAHQLNQYH